MLEQESFFGRTRHYFVELGLTKEIRARVLDLGDTSLRRADASLGMMDLRQGSFNPNFGVSDLFLHATISYVPSFWSAKYRR